MNGHSDVFVRDRRTGKTEIVSISSLGAVAVGHAGGGAGEVTAGPKWYGSQGGAWPMGLSYDPSISADGRYVAFTSAASNLVLGDTNAAVDVFVHDRETGQTDRVSVNSKGEEGVLDATKVRPEALGHGSAMPDSFYPSISAGGRFVSFTSFASNFAEEGDDNGWADVFVHDRQTARTKRVSLSASGGEAEMYVCLSQALDCRPWTPRSSTSASGRWIVFDSVAPDHVQDDVNGLADVFVHDRRSGKNERISVGSNDEEAEESKPQLGWSGAGSSLTGASPFYTASRAISSNGRFVTFVSRASNLIPSDSNRDPLFTGDWSAGQDVFVRDRKTGRTQRISVTSAGRETDALTKNAVIIGNLGYQYPSISSDGRFVAFQGYGLVEGRFKNVQGIYVHDLNTGATELVSRMLIDHDGEKEVETSWIPDISSDGRYVSFASSGWPLERGDRDQTDGMDYFVADRGWVRGSTVGGAPSADEGGEEPLVCIEGVCLPPGTAASRSFTVPAGHDGVPRSGVVLSTSIAHRQVPSDLFLRIDLDRLSGLRIGAVTAGDPSRFYGARFTIGDDTYEMRAQGLGGPLLQGSGVFGLFECTETCTEIAELKGGYGVVGENVVASIPLSYLGLQGGGEIADIEVFGSPGLYPVGSSGFWMQEHRLGRS